MSLPGRLESQRALVLDYRSHFARFGEIAKYLDRWQPPALMLWGRHDTFFDLSETLSWMKALPRMGAHILDGPHLLLKTHAAECAALMSAFLRRTEGQRQDSYLAEIYDTDISRDTISRITDAVVEDMVAWQHRPLDARC